MTTKRQKERIVLDSIKNMTVFLKTAKLSEDNKLAEYIITLGKLLYE